MYAVIMTHTFDPDTPTVVLFEDYDKAKAYLHWLWEDYYNKELADGSDVIGKHWDEYARVFWDEDTITEFILTDISEPDERFKDVDWKRYK